MILVVVLLTCLFIASLGVIVLVSLLFRTSLQKALDHADRVHERQVVMLNGALDRIMAMDFTTYKAYASAEDALEGQFIEPDEPPTVMPGLSTETILDRLRATSFVPPEEPEEDWDANEVDQAGVDYR